MLATWTGFAAECRFDFGRVGLNQSPPGLRSAVTGEGQPGDWKVVEDAPGTTPARSNEDDVAGARRHVLSQLSRDATDERFPLLIYENETFGDFTLTTRFKIVDGVVEQMAGIAFRIQDEKSYYIARASALGGNFRFYKFVNGLRSPPIGPRIEINPGVWHDLIIDCRGNQIRCILNGNEVIAVNDHSFSSGKVGFWTKSDSVSRFADTQIAYTPKVTLAETLVVETLKKHPRLIGLKIYGTSRSNRELRILASTDPAETGEPAGEVERDVVARGVVYGGLGGKETPVTLPIRDRNGEVVAAVRVVLKSFPGQTEQTAVARATPIAREISRRVQSATDLSE